MKDSPFCVAEVCAAVWGLLSEMVLLCKSLHWWKQGGHSLHTPPRSPPPSLPGTQLQAAFPADPFTLEKLKWNRFKITIYEKISWRYCMFAVCDVWASMCAQPMRLLWMLNFSWPLSSAAALWSQGRLLLPPEHLSIITGDELGEKGPWSKAEARLLLGLGSGQGMPSASQGARGLCTACQHLKSHWAADPRASLRERTHFVRTQENFPQFSTLFSVLFNFSEFVFFWRKCWARAWFIQNSPWHLEDDNGFLGFFWRKWCGSHLKALLTQHHKY